MKLNSAKLRRLIEDRNLTMKSFGDKLGLTRNGAYDILKREHIKTDMMDKICQVLSVQAKDFMDSEPHENAQENVTRGTFERKGNIIYVPLFAYGGFLGGYHNTVFMDTLEYFRLPGVTGEHFAFEIGGFSMTKPGHELSATPGDIAISRIVEDFKHMVKGRGYILQTIDGILYKIFDKITDEKASFHSLNEDYDGLSIKLKEIKRVYFVSFILKKTY